jgi:uncharacterized membrane protein YhaH (DUF805 family)
VEKLDLYMAVLKKYAVFNGRANRREYWTYLLINIAIAVVLGVVDRLLGKVGVFGILYGLATLVPGTAVSMRRLHDTNRSGWFLLLGLVPLVGLVLLYFMALEGQAGTNLYGAPQPARS